MYFTSHSCILSGIMAHITSSLPTTSKDATVSSVVVITGAQSSLIENPGVIAACVVIGIVLITLTTITVTTCLFVARIVKKMKGESVHVIEVGEVNRNMETFKVYMNNINNKLAIIIICF